MLALTAALLPRFFSRAHRSTRFIQCTRRVNPRVVHNSLSRRYLSYRNKERYSVIELQRNRFWAQVAGIDPNHDRLSADLWSRFLHHSWASYLSAAFDLSTAWNSQEPVKKEAAYAELASKINEDESLQSFPGLQHHDLLAWRLCVVHRNQRTLLRNFAKQNRRDARDQFLPEIIEALRLGEIKLKGYPHAHQLEQLAQQGARIALTRSEKRQESNELDWEKKRLEMVNEPSNPEADRSDVAQAPNARAAAQRKRWQQWRESLRSGKIDIHTRMRSEESRQRMSELAKERWSKVERTNELSEMKRQVGALGLERQRQLRAARLDP